MAKKAEQKCRILTLYEILLNETDEGHPMVEARLRARLAERGIEAERKTVLDDLHALEDFGVDIENRRGKGGGYYLASRTFELAELKLLVDAVQSSKFISEKKSNVLLKKLYTLTSRYEAEQLRRQVHVCGRVKADSAAAIYAVDTVHAAIAEKRRITFRYSEWGMDKKLHPRHGGALYEVSPYLLTWDDGNYYMVGYDHGAEAKKHFRVDKMTGTALSDKVRGGEEVFSHFDPAVYSRQTFGMYGGEETSVSLLCHNSLVGVVLDRFGEDVTLIPQGEEHFRFQVRVGVSPVFLAWVIGYGKKMRILSPESVADELRALAREALG